MRETPPRLYLNTGCTLLNLALTDRADGGWPCGRIVNPIGDSDTCKTVLGLTALAEACRDSRFDSHSLEYNDVEASLSFDLERMFGKSFCDRVCIRSPLAEEDKSKAPETVQELHYQLLDYLDGEAPFVTVVDSLDGLSSKEELEKTEEEREAWKKSKDTTGTMAMSKQKYFKRMLRELKGKVAKTDSLIMVVSQTIDNVGAVFGPKKSRAGGNALKFFSSHELWLSVMESEKAKGRVIGRKIRCKVSKNQITGKKREIAFWAFDNFGIDDIRTSIEFLLAEKVWARVGGWINAGEFGKLQVGELVRKIEEGLVGKLNEVVQGTWDDIEASLELGRKPRYE
jgi:recombination protein RecA